MCDKTDIKHSKLLKLLTVPLPCITTARGPVQIGYRKFPNNFR